MRSDYGPDDLDPGLLLWDVRRLLAPREFGDRRVVIHPTFPSMAPKQRYFWIIVERDDASSCAGRILDSMSMWASSSTCAR